MSGLKRFLV